MMYDWKKTYGAIFWDALLVSVVLGTLVGEVNSNVAVFGKWTDAEDIEIRDFQTCGEKGGNLESAILTRGVPNRLFSDHVIGIEDISLIALIINGSALLNASGVRPLFFFQ